MISVTHLHAMLFHFPIALLMAGFLFEVIGFFYKKGFFRQFAFYLLITGMLGTVVSYLAGNAAGAGLEEGSLNKAMELHERAATISLWLTLATALQYTGIYFFKYRKSWLSVMAILLFAGTIGNIARTGYLGAIGI